MQSLDDADNRLLAELKSLRATLDATLWKSDAPDMRNNLKAVRVAVDGRLKNLARQDEQLAKRLELAHLERSEDDDVFEQSKRLLQLIDHCIAFRECCDA